MSNKSISELGKLADPDCEFCSGDGWLWDDVYDKRIQKPCICTLEDVGCPECGKFGCSCPEGIEARKNKGENINDISGAEGDPNDR
jgi:hypothetical protein